jgi:hypothetical protein
MGWIEGRLFNFRKVVLGIAIQDDSADCHERVIAMRPDLGYIKRIEARYCATSAAGMTCI